MRGLPTVRSVSPLTARMRRASLLQLYGRNLCKLHENRFRIPVCGAPRTFLNLNNILGGGGSSNGENYNETVVLPYSKEELFAVVSDVDSYAQFVPFCVESRVLGPTKNPDSRTKRERATSIVDAELTIGFSAVRESYVSEVSMRRGEFVTVCYYLTLGSC